MPTPKAMRKMTMGGKYRPPETGMKGMRKMNMPTPGRVGRSISQGYRAVKIAPPSKRRPR